MSARIEVASLANREYDRATRYYAKIGSFLAIRFRTNVIEAMDHVARMPLAGAPHLSGTRIVGVKKYPYYLVYLYQGNVVTFFAVAHTSRRKGYWTRRLP